jgi:hypothetical protein
MNGASLRRYLIKLYRTYKIYRFLVNIANSKWNVYFDLHIKREII